VVLASLLLSQVIWRRETSHGTRGAASGGGARSDILTAAGSMMGSMVASELAASSVRSLHQSSMDSAIGVLQKGVSDCDRTRTTHARTSAHPSMLAIE
jgi:hypothetical protein